MPWGGDNHGLGTGPADGKQAGGESESLRLLRNSHIFAAAVREVMDVKLLREANPAPLSPSQYQILKLMSQDGHRQVGEVAGFLGVSPPAATKNIDKLERLRFVARSPSKGDRRVSLLSVSPKGRRLVRKYEELKAACLSAVLEDFRAEEVNQLARLLERFSVSLLSQEPLSGGYCPRCAGYIENDCPVGRVHGGCPYEKVRGARPGKSAGKTV